MSTSEFDFGDRSVAANYDDVLVPMLFEPWARRLVGQYGPWRGQRVLDLATGTGIVARMLADDMNTDGSVIAADINGEMLALARQRCARVRVPVEFVESPAHPLDLPDASVDRVVCQQGFQFFPDQAAAAREMLRVLRPQGAMVATTWCGVEDCEFFGRVCDALLAIGERELSDLMRAPFDFMPEAELRGHFESAGFRNVEVERQEDAMTLARDVDPIRVAYATPIGPKLRALPEAQQARFRDALIGLLAASSYGDRSAGRMTTNVVTAERPD